jgi:hypothetical protein
VELYRKSWQIGSWLPFILPPNFDSSILERMERDERREEFPREEGGTYNGLMQGAAAIATVFFAFELWLAI